MWQNILKIINSLVDLEKKISSGRNYIIQGSTLAYGREVRLCQSVSTHPEVSTRPGCIQDLADRPWLVASGSSLRAVTGPRTWERPDTESCNPNMTTCSGDIEVASSHLGVL